MSRLALSAAALLCLGLVAAPARAQVDNDVICAETARIVHIAVVQRAGGMKRDSIKAGMTTGRYQVADRFIATVGPLVDWVFAIERAEVEAPDAAQSIVGRYRKGCMAFRP